MRVLIIVRPWSFHGGVESATAGLLRALVEHGHDVHVLSPGAQQEIAGVTVHRLRLPPLPPAARLVALATLAPAVIGRRTWDVVQAHERVLGAHVYRAGEGCHRAYLDALGPPRGRRLYHRLVLGLERRVLRATPRVIAIARRGKDEIERLYRVPRERVAVVYNGVDLERFHPRLREQHRAPAREEAGVAAAAWALLFVGSGFERKGLAMTLAAFAALDDPGSRLIVIGKGDTQRYIAMAERLDVAKRVCWLGAREDVERWYAAADALVLPARYEPFGNVHLEALASGLPVVTSTRAGGAELVHDGANGAVRDPDDVAGIADALRQLRARPSGEVVDLCRRSAEPFTHARQVAALAGIWRGLVARKA
ncbi:MAG: glycosyltransferase family 4 protein [Candidatus Rokubacteria bacterium]|nr:glycosyltransferase family 4 protein [Candidatus Rokubacteria bacterium]